MNLIWRISRLFVTNQKFITGSLLTILLLRFLFAGIMGLMPQDAYYYFYGQHLALSYFDHPPMIAYLLRAFSSLFGEHVYVVKMADTITTLLTLYFFYVLAGLVLSPKKALIACILLFSTLMVSTLSLVSTPDVPLMMFWTVSLIALYKAIFLEQRQYWPLAGILMGLAFCSKYTAAMLPVGLVGFLLLSGKYRHLLLSRWFWLSVLLFFVTISPVVYWNWDHDFASFRFQTEGRVKSGVHLKVSGLFGVLAHQSAILMPILFVGQLWIAFIAVKRTLKKRKLVNDLQLFLLAFFLPVFLLFLSISVFYWVKLNWLMPAYIAGILLCSIYISEKLLRYQIMASLVVHLVMAVEIVMYVVPIRSDDTWYGWDQLASSLKRISAKHPRAFLFSADDYKTSAVLNFYLDSMVYSQNVIGEHALQFDYIGTDLLKLKGMDAIFIDSQPGFSDTEKSSKIPEGLLQYFDSVIELDPLLIINRGKTVRKFLLFHCYRYHPN
jgi:hypothetical protein